MGKKTKGMGRSRTVNSEQYTPTLTKTIQITDKIKITIIKKKKELK